MSAAHTPRSDGSQDERPPGQPASGGPAAGSGGPDRGRDLPPTAALLAFEAALRHGSFSGAARELARRARQRPDMASARS